MPSDARHPREAAAEGVRSIGPRLLRAWSVLDGDRRLAAVSAVLLFVTMLLPWYQQNAVVSGTKNAPLVSRNLNAFAVFSFVEAAVLLVAVAVLVLLYQRAEGRSFQMPGGDGTMLFAAGIWTALLLVLRLFDKPGITHNGVAANVGIQWGIFFALGASGLLAYAGSRMRAAHRPGPPLRREQDVRTRRPRRPQPPPYPPAHPDEPDTAILTAYERSKGMPDTAPAPATQAARRRHPPAPADPRRRPDPVDGEQLSFEDAHREEN